MTAPRVPDSVVTPQPDEGWECGQGPGWECEQGHHKNCHGQGCDCPCHSAGVVTPPEEPSEEELVQIGVKRAMEVFERFHGRGAVPEPALPVSERAWLRVPENRGVEMFYSWFTDRLASGSVTLNQFHRIDITPAFQRFESQCARFRSNVELGVEYPATDLFKALHDLLATFAAALTSEATNV